MKKSIKIIAIIAALSFLTGCIWLMGPSEKVDAMMSKYVKCDKSIMDELNGYLDKQDLNDEEKNRYREVIKREYSTIKYEIKDERIKEDLATVTVDLKVLDLYKASDEAEKYLFKNPSKFYTEGVYDSHKFIDYKLGLMEKCEDTKDYTIEITLSRHDDIWYIEELSEDVLLKIHGIYNYNQK